MGRRPTLPMLLVAASTVLLRPILGTLFAHLPRTTRGRCLGPSIVLQHKLLWSAAPFRDGAASMMQAVQDGVVAQAPADFAYNSLDVEPERRIIVLNSIISTLGFADGLQIEPGQIARYIERCLAAMPPNPYHGPHHVLDVVQFMFATVRATGLDKAMSTSQLAALFFAGIAHDVDHTGTSNSILEATGHEFVAEAEEGVGALESHHARVAQELLRELVLPSLPAEAGETLVKDVVATIHATDMARHKTILEDFVKAHEAGLTASSAAEFFKEGTPNGQLLLQMLMKAADTSNPGRPWSTTKLWNSRVYEEFYAEGDQVKLTGGTPNPMFDRDTNSIPKSSVGFINFHVLPQFRYLQDFLEKSEGAGIAHLKPSGLSALLQQLESNAALFAQEAEAEAESEVKVA
eukprot:TRINITY_DN76375_c0_g1_i1.p1 TRINITY_DN76375_c0_g1~~TRINITY_DN76375_c0_g1_i1.p1  ORF type:complete len:412 (-),score=88.11 TRINITY_DN76375_c0_g1_i1:71-1285(-)